MSDIYLSWSTYEFTILYLSTCFLEVERVTIKPPSENNNTNTKILDQNGLSNFWQIVHGIYTRLAITISVYVWSRQASWLVVITRKPCSMQYFVTLRDWRTMSWTSLEIAGKILKYSTTCKRSIWEETIWTWAILYAGSRPPTMLTVP
jgi:hypothetical protein